MQGEKNGCDSEKNMGTTCTFILIIIAVHLNDTRVSESLAAISQQGS